MKKCTICFEEGKDVKHFCKCDKEVGLYHKKCLIHWVEESGKITCRFCKSCYDIKLDYNWTKYERRDGEIIIVRIPEIKRKIGFVESVLLVPMLNIVLGIIFGHFGRNGNEFSIEHIYTYLIMPWLVCLYVAKFYDAPPLP